MASAAINSMSSFMEKIIALEESTDEADQKKSEAVDKIQQSFQQLDDTSPDEPTTPQSQRKFSDFWYLEDGQSKMSNQLSDRIIEKLLSVIITSDMEPSSGRDVRTVMSKTRPLLSMHLMSSNSTQLAQKTTPVFELMDEVVYTAGWYNPWHTLGVLLIATLAILNPYVVTAFPAMWLLNKFMIPSYLKLYPPDPSLVDNWLTFRNPHPHEGNPLRKFEAPKVVSQYSKEFLMNFTDLQNQMVPYIRLYDSLVNWGQHYFLFEDPRLSSVVFLLLLGNIIFNMLALPRLIPILLAKLPIKPFAVCILWSCFCGLHPAVKSKILDVLDTEEARMARLDRTDRVENILMALISEDESVQDVTRLAEVFELQVLNENKVWEFVGFTSDFFALSHTSRHNTLSTAEDSGSEIDPGESQSSTGEKTDNSQSAQEDAKYRIFQKATLEEIKPPKYWKFAEEKWQIDLLPMRWVNANLIMDLVNVDTDEKWVYDFVNDESNFDGQVYRRRRWVRQCIRDGNYLNALAVAAAPVDVLSKSLTTFLNA